MRKVLVWDIYLRFFHWALALSVITCFVALEINDIYLHMNAGIVTLGLIVFRIFWGFLGPFTARFVNFIKSPKIIWSYLRTGEPKTIGHNPVGSLSVVAMLLLIGFQTVAGLFASAPDSFIYAPLAEKVSEDTSSWFTHWHETNGDIIKILIILHIVAILFYLIVKKQNLIKPMIFGRTNTDHGDGLVNVQHKRAAITIVVSAAITYFFMSQ